MPESCCKTPTSKECGLRIHPSSISFTVHSNSFSSFLTQNIWCSKVSREFFFNVYASFIHQAVLLRSFLAYALDPLYVAIHYFPKWLLATFTFSWIQEDACGILQMLTLSDYKMRPSSLLTHSIINTPQCLKITEKISFNIASEASYVYIFSGQKLIKNAKNGPNWRVFENLKFAVKQCYQTGHFS